LDIVGIDVGGTNTDAVLIKENEIIKAVKTPTNHQDLLDSTLAAFHQLLKAHDQSTPIELHLSTTLSTNAIVERRINRVMVLAIPGPGIHLEDLGLSPDIQVLSGYIDHRGREAAPVDISSAKALAEKAFNKGNTALAIVGKFSPRNPSQELEVEKAISEHFPNVFKLTLGHRLSGSLNFPRRIQTAYLNAGIADNQAAFAKMIEGLLKDNKVCNIYMLKADGGTMSLEESIIRPIETILSGPAAGIMGAQALTGYQKTNAVIVDIGGTTTDISILINGEPVLEHCGAEISGYKTSVSAIYSCSVGLGGDSEINICWQYGSPIFKIGPNRAGAPAACGGIKPTPTDAVVAAGMSTFGNEKKALEALAELGREYSLGPERVAYEVIKAFSNQLIEEIEDTYRRLESRPAYTVSEILAENDIRPKVIIGLGAPAPYYIPAVAERLGIDYEILPFHGVASAVGAATSKPTATINLHADTALGVLTVPEANYHEKIRHPMTYGIKQAREDALYWAKTHAMQKGIDTAKGVEIIEEEGFNKRVSMWSVDITPQVTSITSKHK
jgi:N-methylhydantoinase A